MRPGAGWGPFWLGASRVLLASALLLGLAALLGRRVRPTRSELAVLAISGTMLWLGGNGGVNWAEQRIDSGLAALIIGTMPIWVAIMEAALDRRPPGLLLIASLVGGFGGLAVLTAPMMSGGLRGDTAAVVVVFLGTISWGAGSLLLRRRPVDTPPLTTSGWQQLLGGIAFAAMALAVGEPAPDPTPAAWGAWAYLVVFGSLLAFTSYLQALRLLPTSIVMTYTYVNPVIAVLLGWAILDEPITGRTVVGMALIVTGVLGVFRSRRPPTPPVRATAAAGGRP